MQKQKWNPTNHENAEGRKVMERLRTTGADLAGSAFGTTDTSWISVQSTFTYSSVRVMPGACMFIMYLRIVCLAPKVVVEHFELSTPDPLLNPFILDDPTMVKPTTHFYRLPDGTEFHRDDVLNYRTGAEGTLHRGDVMRGYLLAESFTPVALKYPDRSRMPLGLSISNQFGQVHEAMIRLPIRNIPSPFRPRAERRNRLFDEVEDPSKSREKVWNVLQMPKRFVKRVR